MNVTHVPQEDWDYLVVVFVEPEMLVAEVFGPESITIGTHIADVLGEHASGTGEKIWNVLFMERGDNGTIAFGFRRHTVKAEI